MSFRIAPLLSILIAGPWLTMTTMAAELENTAWRLLNITSMNDSVDLPDDPNQYTLEFHTDGGATLRADCNRGTGTWEASGSRLEFGSTAATRERCPPGSLSEKYLAQFQWVRHFTMKDGHLFLSTMADGSIIEFEPMPSAVATLFGEQVSAGSGHELQGILVTRLLDHYAVDHGIEATEAEVDAYVDHMSRAMAAAGLNAVEDLTPEEQLEYAAMQRNMGHALIRQWKINKSLHETYGGRVIYQQLGPEPLDAYRKYFKEREQAGDFSITDRGMEQVFWDYFTNDEKHEFMEPGSEDLEQAFSTPPWLN